MTMVKANVTKFNELSKKGEVIVIRKNGYDYDVIKINGERIAFFNHQTKKIRIREDFLNN